MRRMSVFILAVACALGACAFESSLTREQAVAAARSAFQFDGVIDATVGPIDRFDPGQAQFPGDHLVWAVVVSGTFQGSCGPAPAPGTTPRPCPPPAKRATVVVDYFTGEFIVATSTSGT
jgi:hypothetical protein